MPPGFRAAAGTQPEPYTGTGWAKEIVHEVTGMELVFIPAGKLVMGTPTHGPKRGNTENAWGLYDMHGNVWEWCADWWTREYPSDLVTDPMGPASGRDHVKRGGAYASIPIDSGFHGYGVYGVYDRDSDTGFRVVVSLAGVDSP